MPKKVLTAFPSGMLEQIDFVAQVEHRTRSDLIREALRRYINGFQRTGANVNESPNRSPKSIIVNKPEVDNGPRHFPLPRRRDVVYTKPSVVTDPNIYAGPIVY